MNTLVPPERAVLVGGFPQPVGGVTTFLSRLVRAYPARIVAVVDLYPADRKSVPAVFHGIYYRSGSRLGAWIGLLCCLWKFRAGHEYLFNFSRLHSLIVFLLLPKFTGVRWMLLLHHGSLVSSLPEWLLRRLLRRFDNVLAIGPGQAAAYHKLGVPADRLRVISTYVPARVEPGEASAEVARFIDELRAGQAQLVVASGFPRQMYRHDLAMTLVRRPRTRLALCLYGDGELRNLYEDCQEANVQVFWNLAENDFNYLLSMAGLYVRPTERDSFGIACADAVGFGVPVIASDVCMRAPGVLTYPSGDDDAFVALALKVMDERSNECPHGPATTPGQGK